MSLLRVKRPAAGKHLARQPAQTKEPNRRGTRSTGSGETKKNVRESTTAGKRPAAKGPARVRATGPEGCGLVPTSLGRGGTKRPAAGTPPDGGGEVPEERKELEDDEGRGSESCSPQCGASLRSGTGSGEAAQTTAGRAAPTGGRQRPRSGRCQPAAVQRRRQKAALRQAGGRQRTRKVAATTACAAVLRAGAAMSRATPGLRVGTRRRSGGYQPLRWESPG